jgi:DNA-binding transcriptional MerR regulator
VILNRRLTSEEPVLDKAPDAFRTISEVADELDIPQHVLRFWETRFSQIKPMKRSGGRRFYRPDDVDLLRGIRRLLYGEGYTIRGVQRILKEQGIKSVQALSDTAKAVPSLYALDDGVRVRPPRHDDAEAEAAAADEEPAADDEIATAPEPIAPPPRRPMATPLPRNDVAPQTAPPRAASSVLAAATLEHAVEPAPAPARAPTPPPKPDRRPLDIIRLKAVMSDLVACRQMLDRALQDS